MAGVTRVNGFGNYLTTGGLRSTAQLKAYVIDAGADLRSEDDGAEEAVEALMREVSPLMYDIVNDANGKVHVIVDGHHGDATVLQARIRHLGTVGGNDYDFSGATVTLGANIVVS